MSPSKYKYGSNHLVDSIFWISIIFYIDPGGFFSFYVDKNILGFHYQVALTAILYLCFFVRFQNWENLIFQNKLVFNYIIKISIWFLYYLLIFGWLNTDLIDNPFGMITKGYRIIFQGIIVIPIIYFSVINLKLFVKILSWTTLIVLVLYIISVLTKIELIPIKIGNRGYIDAIRYSLFGYGLIFFTLTITISYLLSKYKLNYVVLTCGILVIMMIFISISRRGIIGIVEYFIIISMLYSYIWYGKMFKGIKRLFIFGNIGFTILFLLLISLFFSDYLGYGVKSINESINVIFYNETSKGTIDVRMSFFGKTGIVDAIKDNFWFGTGFDPAWNTGDGGKKGWEGSDYIFLSAFAMYGFVGLLIFLPFYIIAFKVIVKFIKTIRYNRAIVLNNKYYFELPIVIGIAASAEFIKNIIEYPNWFYPIGAIAYSPQYFIYFGLLIGSYLSFQNRLLIFKIPK